ncbi:hypothetical protein WOLCODRAFT_163362 [Wolfiporia cocos MD-104 SS10]|uniref:Uncharacterized protein n=1 Tax=Wolfiporia cocos (strain MD-104) TaxID=742152 RepID=A0A2H3JJP4_WOLCO|nr:hypothetical protein WOLCODRAFT_163362 [Wolfiporia cocos MD-104 SS10]
MPHTYKPQPSGNLGAISSPTGRDRLRSPIPPKRCPSVARRSAGSLAARTEGDSRARAPPHKARQKSDSEFHPCAVARNGRGCIRQRSDPAFAHSVAQSPRLMPRHAADSVPTPPLDIRELDWTSELGCASARRLDIHERPGPSIARVQQAPSVDPGSGDQTAPGMQCTVRSSGTPALHPAQAIYLGAPAAVWHCPRRTGSDCLLRVDEDDSSGAGRRVRGAPRP